MKILENSTIIMNKIELHSLLNLLDYLLRSSRSFGLSRVSGGGGEKRYPSPPWAMAKPRTMNVSYSN